MVLFIIPLLLLSLKHAQFVQMVMSDLLVAPLRMKDVLSSATTMPGALSVMTIGAYLMLMLFVDNLDTLTRVSTHHLYSRHRQRLIMASSTQS
jgi:hypothetical protein